MDTYTDIHPIIVAARVLAPTQTAKDCFEDVRRVIVIIVTLCLIVRAITGTLTTCGDIITAKSGCKPPGSNQLP